MMMLFIVVFADRANQTDYSDKFALTITFFTLKE